MDELTWPRPHSKSVACRKKIECIRLSGLSSMLKPFLAAAVAVVSDPCPCVPHGVLLCPLPLPNLPHCLHLLTRLAPYKVIILTPIRMASIKNKTENNKCWWGYEETGTLVRSWWECKMVQLLQKTVWNILIIFKIELAYDPAIPLLGIYPKELKQDLKEIFAHSCSQQPYSQ